MDFSNFWWQAAAGPGPGPGPGGDPIGQSLRFRGSSSLSGHTGGSGTASVWIKHAKLGAAQTVMPGIAFDASDKLNSSVAVFRDSSAWMHVVVNANGTYVNGVSVASGSAISAGTIGASCELYLAQFYFVEGVIEPTEFGRFNSQGVWVPVDAQGLTYGTSGFKLTFEDPSNIGKDYSGNGNDFAGTGFELADQSSTYYDLMQDSPTQNYATLNPLVPGNTSFKFASANLSATYPNALNQERGFNGMQLSTQKAYWEINIVDYGETMEFGIATQKAFAAVVNTSLDSYTVRTNGEIHANGTRVSTGNPTFNSNGSVAGFTWDGNSGVLQYTVDGATYTTIATDPGNYFVVARIGANCEVATNFGQRPFAYAPPAEFEALQTQNMPTDELPDEITGTFTGNNNVNGPFVYTGCIPGRIQYGSVDVTYDQRLGQTDVDFLSNGFKVRSTTSNSGAVNYTVTTTHTGGEYDGNKIPFYLPAPATSN